MLLSGIQFTQVQRSLSLSLPMDFSSHKFLLYMAPIRAPKLGARAHFLIMISQQYESVTIWLTALNTCKVNKRELNTT
jgi:hypothetical protein